MMNAENNIKNRLLHDRLEVTQSLEYLAMNLKKRGMFEKEKRDLFFSSIQRCIKILQNQVKSSEVSQINRDLSEREKNLKKQILSLEEMASKLSSNKLYNMETPYSLAQQLEKIAFNLKPS